MYNENVVYFERYFVIYFSYLLCFLDDIAEIIYVKFGIAKQAELTDTNSGCVVIISWMDDFLKLEGS
jgi:hypothetical protein